MDMIKLSANLSDMEEYEPLPQGLYPAEVRDCEIRHSEKVPEGYIYMQLRVDPDDYPADYDPSNAPEGVQLIYASVKVPDGKDRRKVRPFKQLMKALGQDISAATFDPSAWTGQHVQVLIRTSEYQGALVNNVDAVSELPTV